MSAVTITNRSSGPRSAANHRVRARLFAWIVAFSVLAGAAWIVIGGERRHVALEPGASASVPGGRLRLDGLGTEEATHLPMSMPGMDHAPIADGHYLLRLDATLIAADDAITYTPDDFTMHIEGAKPIKPYRAVAGPGRLYVGMSAPLLLVFEVPVDARDLHLEYGDRSIMIGGVDGATASHDH